MLKKWEEIPSYMKNETVKEYYDVLEKKKVSLFFKRIFDIIVSLIMIIILSPALLLISIIIKLDSKGPVLYRQERVTQCGRVFRVCKFRTMVVDADKIGTHVTVDADPRITRVGNKIRRFRIDELPQLFNILAGTMTFVGTRPEVTKYVEHYTPEMMATLLLPAGVTSEASIMFKDESEMLKNVSNVDEEYVKRVLPEKMRYNLKALKNYSFLNDIRLMFRTVFAVFE